MYTHGHPLRLYNLERDPGELEDLAGESGHAGIVTRLERELMARWNPEEVLERVLASQRRRLFIRDVARRSGRLPEWSYQARRDDGRRFVRASGAAGAKARARFPFVPPEEPG